MKDYSFQYRDEILEVLDTFANNGEIESAIDAASPDWYEYDDLVPGVNGFRCNIRNYWCDVKDSYINDQVKNNINSVFEVASECDSAYGSEMSEYANKAMVELKCLQSFTDIMQGSKDTFISNNGGSIWLDYCKELLTNSMLDIDMIMYCVEKYNIDFTKEEVQNLLDIGYTPKDIISIVNVALKDENIETLVSLLADGKYSELAQIDPDDFIAKDDMAKIILAGFASKLLNYNENPKQKFTDFLNELCFYSQDMNDSGIASFGVDYINMITIAEQALLQTNTFSLYHCKMKDFDKYAEKQDTLVNTSTFLMQLINIWKL